MAMELHIWIGNDRTLNPSDVEETLAILGAQVVEDNEHLDLRYTVAEVADGPDEDDETPEDEYAEVRAEAYAEILYSEGEVALEAENVKGLDETK